MEMLHALLAAIVLAGSAVIIHYEGLRAISTFTSKLEIPHRTLSLVVVTGVLLLHLVEICLYAAGFFVMHAYLGLGSIAGGIAALLGFAFLGLRPQSSQKPKRPAVEVGGPILGFSAPDENGVDFDLSNLKGKPYLLKFFRGHW